MKYLYKLPQRRFPYEDLIKENARRGKLDREYNIIDTDAFKDDRYFDIFIETAKEDDDEEELLFRVTAYNRGPEAAPLHIIPHMWFRNTWTWGHEEASKKPSIRIVGPMTAQSKHHKLGTRFFQLSPSPGCGADAEDVQPQLMFTENDTNHEVLYKQKNKQPYVKDAFHRWIVDEEKGAINPRCHGTKCAAWYDFGQGEGVPPGECAVVRFRLSKKFDGYLNEELLDDIPGLGLLNVTSPDLLHRGWSARHASRWQARKSASAHVETLLSALSPSAGLVTILDGSPATLSWLGAVRGMRVSPLGIDRFGQTGDLPDLYRIHRLDADAIIDAAAELFLGK